MNFFELLQEMKFDAASEDRIKSISSGELINLIHKLAADTFGSQAVHRYGGHSDPTIDITMGDRHFTMTIKDVDRSGGDTRRLPEGMPAVYISFNWDNRPAHDERSQKRDADSMYAVRLEIQKDTLEGMHKIRDSIIRHLSTYAVGITYIPIGDRRKSLYQGILSTSGFKPVRGSWDDYWVPTNLRLKEEL